MGTLDNISQKLKGKTQQVKGKIENATGNHLKGNIDMILGKANVDIANIKMKHK
jgi:hypothetical protein